MATPQPYISLAVGGLAVGALLAILVWPILWSSLAAFPSESIHRKIVSREDISLSEIEYYLLSRREAEARWPQPKWTSDVSIGLGLKAAHSASDQRALFEQGRQATRIVLSQRPSDAAAWIRYGNLSLVLGQDVQLAVSALKIAFETGAHSPRLRFAAIILGLKLWHHLELEDRRQVVDAMPVAWKEGPRQRLALLQAARQQQMEGVLELALASDLVASDQVRRLEDHLDGLDRAD